MKKLVLIVVLAAIAGVGLLTLYKKSPPQFPPLNGSVTSSVPQQAWETQKDEQAGVTVSVIPIDLAVDSQKWKFDVVMDTHSVELDQDMVKIAVLVDDFGKEYDSMGWEGAPAGGHHRGGILIFAPVVPYPQHLKLKIKEIAGVERLFSWVLTE